MSKGIRKPVSIIMSLALIFCSVAAAHNIASADDSAAPPDPYIAVVNSVGGYIILNGTDDADWIPYGGRINVTGEFKTADGTEYVKGTYEGRNVEVQKSYVVREEDFKPQGNNETSKADSTRPTSIRDIIPTTVYSSTAQDSILDKLTTSTGVIVDYNRTTYIYDPIITLSPSYTAGTPEYGKDGTAVYYVTFYANGYKIAKVPYVTSAKSIEEPPVPIIDGYVGRWEPYELDGGDKTVNAVYSPLSIAVFYVTFVADGKNVSKVPFVYGMKEIKEPDVPEKRGYTGEWSEYSLIPCDITVNAVYTRNGNIFTNFFRTVIEFFRNLFDFSGIKRDNPREIGESSTAKAYQDPSKIVTTRRRNPTTTATRQHLSTTSQTEYYSSIAFEDINNSDTESVLNFYNAARKATKPAPKGNQTMALSGEITCDGFAGALLNVLEPAAKSALEKNSRETDWIPAANHADIRLEDVTYARASTKDGVTTVEIVFKDQVDGPNGDAYNGGPVARGIGTIGSIDRVLNELGAEITEGKDTVKLTYTDAYLTAKIKDGKVIGGTWHYRVKIFVGNAKGKLGISLTLKNINAEIDYRVVI